MSSLLRQMPAPDLVRAFRAVRGQSLALSALLSAEDQCLQSMPEASPTKWHLAHTTWFFETFVLAAHLPGYEPYHPRYRYLFNSYYNAVGPQYPRPQRGLLSRPSLDEVYAYRAHVDDRLATLIGRGADPELEFLVNLGLHHEQQHQELAVTDIKHALWHNPLKPAVVAAPERGAGSVPATTYREIPEGLYQIGHAGGGFAFDNERPRHRVYLASCRIAERPVTTGEYLAFVEAGGYSEPSLWLADGWGWLASQGVAMPLYWERDQDGTIGQYSLGGFRPLDPAEPICHLSYYEADAYARWVGKRLPTEAEWEVAFADCPSAVGDCLELSRLHPRPLRGGGAPWDRGFGGVWEWTASAYCAYPGYAPAAGAIGEYNGKFMSNQMVLRGGSCATPPGHIRASYRNFFPPDARWQFSGLRLAE